MTVPSVSRQAPKVPMKAMPMRFLNVRIVEHRFQEFVQDGGGRPGPDTRYRREEIPRLVFEVQDDQQALREEAINDGRFPLITNSKPSRPPRPSTSTSISHISKSGAHR